MPKSSSPKLSAQPHLFPADESIASVELFPAVWGAAEALISPDAETRHAGLVRLLELGAARASPLVAYLLFSLLTDPDLQLRTQLVQVLSELLSADRDGRPAPEEVRHSLFHYLSQMRTRHVFALLQVILHDSSCDAHVARLLDACPYAGNHLLTILNDRAISLDIRELAARLIGQVGYLNVFQALERLVDRLEARMNGQRSMPFAPPSSLDDSRLLPAVRAALDLLRD